MGRKYDNTITNLNMLHGNGHFPPFIDDFPIEITNFWGISSELDLDSWVQQDPAPGPAGGPWRRSKGWRSRRGPQRSSKLAGCPGERIRLLDSWMIPWKNGL